MFCEIHLYTTIHIFLPEFLKPLLNNHFCGKTDIDKNTIQENKDEEVSHPQSLRFHVKFPRVLHQSCLTYSVTHFTVVF